MTANKITVPMTEMTIDPRQPSLLEKKANICGSVSLEAGQLAAHLSANTIRRRAPRFPSVMRPGRAVLRAPLDRRFDLLGKPGGIGCLVEDLEGGMLVRGDTHLFGDLFQQR